MSVVALALVAHYLRSNLLILTRSYLRSRTVDYSINSYTGGR